MKTKTKTAGTLLAIGVAAASAAGAQAAGALAAGASAKPSSKTARGSSCAKPWVASYSRGKVTGDTREVSLAVTVKGRTITVSWHAQPGYQFCSLVLVEGRGAILRSTNPATSYTYTDSTPNHSNGIRTLRASARNRSRPSKR